MSTTTRLEAYKTAELQILEAQEIRGGDRTYRMAELQEVRSAISALERQLAREQSASSRKLRHSLGNFNPDMS